VADRATAYGIPGVVVDGGDAMACYRVAREATERARRGEGPTLVEAKVLRLTSHSSDDDQRRYRSLEVLEEEKQRDGVLRFRAQLEELGVLKPGDAEEMRAELVRELDRPLDEAEVAPLPDPATVLRHVYAEDR
ncbi:MAG TPA: thiamine pyrophosphate-dependent enzyme, partial [Candidatus Dormibacteraeota bacterium]|nr:thiamine pyrophosphate-dependent enzyme [Candidatus Dormibacteraeota bacterium]